MPRRSPTVAPMPATVAAINGGSQSNNHNSVRRNKSRDPSDRKDEDAPPQHNPTLPPKRSPLTHEAAAAIGTDGKKREKSRSAPSRLSAGPKAAPMLHSSSAGVGTYRKTTVKRRHPKAQQSSTVPPPPATAAEALAAETNGTADNTNNNTARGSKRRTIPPPVVESTTKKSGSHKKAVQKGPVFSLRTTDRQRAIYEALDGLMASPLPELQEPQEIKTYSEASLEETLYKLIENNDVIMVAGAFFGDEGKGKTVDAVAHHPLCTCIARTNSGENAGHTVYDKEGRKFVFNLAPSGLLTPGKKNYIGPECVLDPISFMEKEVKQLLDAGIEYHDRLFIGNACIVTPYHKLLDLLGSAVNASTLKGMAPVHASKVTKRGIRLDHIFNDEETLRERLSKDMETYFGLMKVQGLKDSDVVRRCHEENSDGVERVPKYVIDFARSKDKVQFLLDLYRTRVRENPEFPTRCDVIHTLRAAIQNGEKVLLEGPQSYWLSNAREHFWCSTTSADTTAAGLLATAQLNFQNCRAVVINVHKAPASSRVGLGACPCSFVPQDFFSGQGIKTLHDLPENMCADFDAIQHKYFTEAYKNIDDPESFKGIAEPIEYTDSTGIYNIGVAMAVAGSIHHGECGAVTRKPRICGLFDCVLQSEVSAVQGPYLSISALDRGDDYDRVGVTIAYIYYSPENIEVDVNGKKYKNGDIIRAGDPVPGEAALYHCHPITKLVKGWKESPIAATVRQQNDPLPDGLCEFLATVEHFCGCKVLSIGNGPSGDDIIYLQQDEEEDEEEE